LLRRAGVNGKAWLLLYAGRLAPEKNLGLLLETLQHLCRENEDYRLLIAGDGLSRAQFEKEAASRFGTRVVWLGHIANREQLASLYANCDFFLHPNPREPFGIAPLEAMASGLMLVAPNSGGVTSFANDHNARVVEPTGTAFASAVRELASNPVTRQQIANAAGKTAEQYSWTTVTDRFLGLYETLLRVRARHQEIRDAGAKFVSSPPSASRHGAMSAAATLARIGYSVASRCAGLMQLQRRIRTTVEE
jgi:alpha-1,6-mannosyltransferase